MPGFFDRPRKPRKGFSLDRRPQDAKGHERDTAKSLGGYPTAGSGNKPGQKSDVVVPKGRIHDSTARVECKKTSRKSITISLKWLEKIAREAVESGRTPVIALRFECAEFAEADWVMVERRHYEELTDEQ
jgi:Holliday junction resolvase